MRTDGAKISPVTVSEIVQHYITLYRDAAHEEMSFFNEESNPANAIRRAALCQWGEKRKRHPHQRRIPRRLLEQVEERLQAIRQRLAKATDFAALHKLVEEEVGSIKGIGPLTVYDIAHRIGAYFRKPPELVYLHAGTRIGARIFNITGDSFDPKILPKPFSHLSAAEIEDCLCIYKDELRGVFSSRSRRNSGCGVARRQLRCLE